MTITGLSSSWLQSDDLGASIERVEMSELGNANDPGVVLRTRTNTDTEVEYSSESVNYRFGVSSHKRSISFPTFLDVVLTFFGFALLLVIEATYFRIVGAIIGLDLKIDQWFALVAFSRIPGDVCVLLITILLTLVFLISSELMGLESATLLRLIHGNTSSFPSVDYFLEYWYFAGIWVIALQTIGFRDWSGRSTSVSLAIVVAPSVLFYGIWWWLVS